MLVDGNFGGVIDGTAGGDLADLDEQIAAADRAGLDGIWTTEISRDPFLPLALAARQSTRLTLGTAIAVAFARNPMTVAVTANDLHCLSGGRFVLGLGTQVRAHITRRFGMPWSAPAARMREFVLAVRAIWSCWEHGTELDFRGDFYQHTLMTPMFRPQLSPWGTPPVLLAAVGAEMTRTAAEVGDGLIVHALTSERFLREVTMPIVSGGLRKSSRERGEFTISLPGLVATGSDDRALEVAVRAVREQIAFYGATPAYRAVLDLHGWGDLHTELHRMSKAGQWSTMPDLIDDTVLGTFAVVGDPEHVGAEIRRRFDGLVDRFTLYTPYPMADSVRARVVDAVHRRPVT
ncbi:MULTISPECIES: LLM class F420-dependent oxidoreductase [Nocardia]|uniref:LLM class F420-dependent oxidoreductase n=1 Tax=Nocardia TaxID=1817 RepID=UPI000D692DE2|nr:MULTISPECIES: LLM class F420-dependent oxidoreductase [Nocardia]